MATLAQGEPSSLADRALDWIHANYRAFMATGPRLLELRLRAARSSAEAYAAGDLDAKAAADTLNRELSALYTRWSFTAEQLRWVVSKVPGLGTLGGWVVPIGVSAVALAAFVAGVAIMREAALKEEALRLLEAGALTPADAAALGLDLSSPFFSFGSGAMFGALALGGGLWWLSRRAAR